MQHVSPSGLYRENNEPPLTPEETTMALLAHVLALVGGGFIGPLVILLTKGSESRFVKFHALSALIFSIALFGIMFVGMFGGVFLTAILSVHHEPGPKGAPPVGFLVLFPMMGLLMMTYVISCIVLGIRAKDGKWSAFPGIGYVVRKMMA